MAGERRTLNAAGNNLFYDGADVTQELSGGTPVANRIVGGTDEFFTRTDSTGTYTPITDALGSVLGLADSTGNIITQYTYDPFGNTTSSGAASSNTSQYAGRENDGSGLYYYRNRYCSTTLGRFISRDPIGLTGGINQYAYAGDTPINFIDPWGLQQEVPSCGVDCVHSSEEIAAIMQGISARDQQLAEIENVKPNLPLAGRKPDSFGDCLKHEARWFSMEGALDLAFDTNTTESPWWNAAIGNDVTGLAFVFVGDEENAPESAGAAINAVWHYGFLAGLGKAGGILAKDAAEAPILLYKGSLDPALTGSLAIDCAVGAF